VPASGTTERTLTAEQARAFYDRLGSRQDWQRFFEDPAVEAMLQHGDFGHATSVLEFGCGTGQLAERLLTQFIPSDCRYSGIDLSDTMVRLARERLKPWAERATVRLADGSCTLGEADRSMNRIVSAYVLDLIAGERIAVFLGEATRVLTADGLLCLVSLSHGQKSFARFVSSTWKRVHALSPWMVGGCRPIDLTEFLAPSQWQIKHTQFVYSLGITSQVVVASKHKGA